MMGLNLPKSYFGLDTHGLVIRLDSVSKWIAPGMRVGWIVAPSAMIERLLYHSQITIQQPAGISQAFLYTLFEALGRDGLDNMMKRLQWAYFQRRRIIVKSARRHLAGLVNFTVPRSGMFLWLDCSPSGIHDAAARIPDLVKAKVLVVPGNWFLEQRGPSQFLRATYSAASEEGLDEGMRRLGKALAQIREGGLPPIHIVTHD